LTAKRAEKVREGRKEKQDRTRGACFGRWKPASRFLYYLEEMAFPIKVCAICSDEFELTPGKPGFANHCPECTAQEANDPTPKRRMDADERKVSSEANAARRQAMRDLLYRKDS
jgi:hypothetical protein